MTSVDPFAASSGPSSGRVLALISGAIILSTLNFSIIFVALGEIEQSLSVGPGAASWALTSYSITLAALIVPAGWLADRLGRKRTFLSGVACFTVGSAAVALAPSVELLVAARILQAVGSAMEGPAGLALLLDATPIHRRSSAVGAFSAIAGIAAALGPILGGVLIEATSWRWMFSLNIPIGVATVIWGRRALTESRRSQSRERPDLLGALFIAVGAGAFVLGLVQSEVWGWLDFRTGVALVGGVMLIAALIVRSLRHASPVMDLSLFRDRNFTLANVMALCFGASFPAMYLGLIRFLTEEWQYSLRSAGLLLALIPGVAGPLSLWSGRLADRYGHRVLMIPGGVCTVVAAVWMLLAVEGERSLGQMWFGAVGLYAVGVGLGFAAMEGAAVWSLPADRLGSGTAVHRIFGEVGASLTVALTVVLLAQGADGSLDGYRRLFIMLAIIGVLAIVLAAPINTRPSWRTARSGD